MILDKEHCTSCGACVAACPKKCISMKADEYSTLYPEIDESKCIKCKKCETVCHARYDKTFVFPSAVYVAWSRDNKTRDNGASGGIASEIYRYAIDNNIFAMAAKFNRNSGVVFSAVQCHDDINWACDSKYVFSDMTPCFDEYKKRLTQGKRCIFIGLPCQCAAIRRYCATYDELVTVEIICHGVPNWEYLRQHLEGIERRTQSNVESIRFRMLSTYDLCLYGTDHTLLYHKGMHCDDPYYRAFAVNLDFRENCYHCAFAHAMRASDLTLGDPSNFGKYWPYSGERKQTSLVLCMSGKGQKLLDMLNIEKVPRPLDEPLSTDGNPQLLHPSIPHPARSLFLRRYKEAHDFDKSASAALQPLFAQYRAARTKKAVNAAVHNIVPQPVKKAIKRMLGRG